jgi:hypothetical protein
MNRFLLFVCVFLCTFGTSDAAQFDGGGVGPALEKLNIEGCGSVEYSDDDLQLYLDHKNDWYMTSDRGTYNGTYTEIKPGKEFRLEFTSDSYSNYTSTLEQDINQICGTSSGDHKIMDVAVDNFSVELNKKQKKASLHLKFSGTISDEFISNIFDYQSNVKIKISKLDCGEERKIKGAITRMQSVLADDINADGAADVVFTMFKYKLNHNKRWLTNGYVVVYLQDPYSPGVFKKRKEYLVLPRFKSKYIGSSKLYIAAGDLNLDGITDLVVSLPAMNSVGILLQRPGRPGTFSPVEFFSTPYPPQNVAIDDVNGDGSNDIVVSGERLVLMLNQSSYPDASFAIVPYDHENITSVAIHDMNQDSHKDLVVTIDDSIFIIFQQSESSDQGVPEFLLDYTELPLVEYPAGMSPLGWIVEDINSDNLNDVIEAHADFWGGGDVSLWLQDDLNHGELLSHGHFPGVHGPDDVEVEDINGDGYVDLVLADKCYSRKKSAYIRYQDPNRLGNFLYPTYLP